MESSFKRAHCGCMGIEMVDGRFFCIQACDNDWHDPEIDPCIRSDIRIDMGKPQPLSEIEEKEVIEKLISLIVCGNKFKKIKSLLGI